MHDRTMDLLRSNMDAFTKVAEILLEKEVIFADDLEAILGPKVKAETDAVKEDNGDGNEQCS